MQFIGFIEVVESNKLISMGDDVLVGFGIVESFEDTRDVMVLENNTIFIRG